MNALDTFKLDGKVVVITGGAGLLGVRHAQAVLDAGGSAALLDVSEERLGGVEDELGGVYGRERVKGYVCDITRREPVEAVCREMLADFGHVDVLINNASNNPKVEGGSPDAGDKQDAGGNPCAGNNINWSRFENFPVDVWNSDIAVGLTGAFICSQVFGTLFAEQHGGVIINISSDLGVIAPDQRLYRKKGLAEHEQPVKPVTYSVVKHALIGLTKYLATYWAKDGVRVNAVCPGGVFNGQDDEFVRRVEDLIPMGRMASPDDYKGIIVFLASDASAYMTGATVIADGGRTVW